MRRKLLNGKQLAVMLLFSAAAFSSYARQNPDLIASQERNAKDNTPTHIVFKDGANLRMESSAEVLKDYLELNGANELRLKKSQSPSAGITIQRFEQWYEGVKVEHGSYAVMSKNGIISFMHGAIYKPAQAIPVAPAITEAAALQQALTHIGAKKYVWEDPNAEAYLKRITRKEDTSYFPKAEMVWVEDFNNGELDKQLHLAYRFNVYAQQPMSRDYVYVDAVNGKILLTDAILKHVAANGKSVYSGTVSIETTLNGTDYILQDQTRATLNGIGIYTGTYGGGNTSTSDVTNSSTTWPENVAIDAHWGAVQVYDYWKTKHNRLSWDNTDAELISYVNFDPNGFGGGGYNNAFWNGTEMTYGDGRSLLLGANNFDPLTSLDVCGHEIGHGVCQDVCGLVYQKESGAMNEGFSDIWGETIEHFATPNKPLWQIGAEIGRNPLRSMSNPKLYGDPSTYGGTYWVSQSCTPSSGNDYCGVHTNSGVLNKWYYLLSDGEAGTNDVSTSYVVAGIGIDKAAEIAFNTESMLTSNDNYAACRTASISVATTLYGACSAETEAVTRAWRAVNVGAAYVPCGPQIGFVTDDTVINKEVASVACPASQILTLPVQISSAPTGGNATVTVTGSGTAVNGVDYKILNSPLTFNAGSTTPQSVQVEILDHGAIDVAKQLVLDLAVNQNGSNAVEGNVYHQFKITIKNNNKAPHPGGDIDYTAGKANMVTNIATPLFSAGQSAHSQFIVSAADLKESGLAANTPITHISFNVVDKKSTRPFTGYTIKMGQTTQAKYSGAFITTGLSTYYNGNLTTTAGWNKIPLSTPMTWDGTSNIVVEVCFANSVANNDSNDRVEAVTAVDNVTAYGFTFSAITGCALPYVNNQLSNSRALIRFTQNVPATLVENASPNGRTWDIHTSQNVYYYSSANSKLVANITNASQNLGCVTANVTQQGNGFVTHAYDNTVKRSVKEFSITPSQANTTANYQATLFYDTTELGTTNLANVRIVKTNAATDAAMNTSNSQLVVPTITTAPGYKGFTGNFTGFSRFYLVDKDINFVSVAKVDAAHSLRVDNNPFTDKIGITYYINVPVKAQVNLYDVTGKVLYHAERMLQNNEHNFSIDLRNMSLVPANYVLQIITPNDVLTQKMVKQ